MRSITLPDEATLLNLAETPLRQTRRTGISTVASGASKKAAASTYVLSYGDNGYQKFFIGGGILLFNPYSGALNTDDPLSYGWQAAQQHAGNWHAVLESVPDRSLYDAKALVEAHLGVSLTLEGADVATPDNFDGFSIRREGAAIEYARTLTLDQYLIPMSAVEALPFNIDDDSRIQVYRAGRDILLDDGSIVTIAGFSQWGKDSFVTTWRWHGEADLLPDGQLARDDEDYRLIWTQRIRGVLVDDHQLNALRESLSVDIHPLCEKVSASQPGNWFQVGRKQAYTAPSNTDSPEESDKPARLIPSLIDWLSQKHHIQRSGNDSYYVHADGTRVLWAGTTSRWAVIVRQHHALVRAAIRWRDTEPVDIYPSIYEEYPDLAEYAGVVTHDTDSLPAWAMDKATFVGLTDVDRKSRSYAHKHIVNLALAHGYDVPPVVAATYPDLAKKYGIQLPETLPSIEADSPAQEKTAPTSDIAETFKRWELHLLTGIVNTRRKSAFNRALFAIEDKAVLAYALTKISATDVKRRAAISRRIQKLSKKQEASNEN